MKSRHCFGCGNKLDPRATECPSCHRKMEECPKCKRLVTVEGGRFVYHGPSNGWFTCPGSHKLANPAEVCGRIG